MLPCSASLPCPAQPCWCLQPTCRPPVPLEQPHLSMQLCQYLATHLPPCAALRVCCLELQWASGDRGACYLHGMTLDAMKVVHYGYHNTPDNHGTQGHMGHPGACQAGAGMLPCCSKHCPRQQAVERLPVYFELFEIGSCTNVAQSARKRGKSGCCAPRPPLCAVQPMAASTP